MLAKTLTKMRFLAIFLSFSYIQPQPSLTVQPNLWHQIIPLIGNVDITKAQTTEEAFKACTARAILLHGKSYEALNEEMLQTIQSLHLFSHVLPKISSYNLRLGYFSFAKNICQVTDDLNILHTKAAYNTYLLNNSEITQELDIILQNLKTTESDFLINFYSKPPKETTESTNFVENGIKALETVEKNICSNRFTGELYKRLGQITALSFVYASAITIFGWNTKKETFEKTYDLKTLMPNLAPKKFSFASLYNSMETFFNWDNHKKTSVLKKIMSDPSKNPTVTVRWEGDDYRTTYNIKDYYRKQVDNVASFWTPVLGEKNAREFASAPINAIPWTTLAILGTVVGAVNTAKGLKATFDDSYQKNKSLLLLKELIKTCQKIVTIVEKNSELEQFLPEYSVIKQFVAYKTDAKSLSKKMVHLIDLLHYYPFNSEPSYYISWQGKINETFLLYEEIHHEFMPLWQALAEIDAQLCAHKLLNSKSNNFCIPEWINQEKPAIEVQGYWHPMISIEKAVANNIALGISNIAHNAIVTGANAGGKTTAMTALMLCAIFSQSIGIVPAKIYRATPFARMHTYLDITTNLAENESLFMAQANRAKHLYESIKNCNPHKKTLTILDEIFTGTRADFAEKASYEFAKKLGKMPHSMCIIATHFPKLTELEKINLFTNYQAAAAAINEDGSLTYPYLIIPGISTQNIADHILKNKGILAS